MMHQWVSQNGTGVYQVLGGRSNVYLITTPSEKHFLVDAGIGWSWKTLERNLKQFKISGESLCLILTHSHFDHAENAKNIKDQYQAKILIHRSEAEYLTTGSAPEIRGTVLFSRALVNLFGRQYMSVRKYPRVNSDIQVGERHLISDSDGQIYTYHTPGHSPGSLSVIVDDEIAIVGDTMFGVFPGSVFPPYALDIKMMVESWEKLLDTGCSCFLPGHGKQISRELLKKQYDRYRMY